MNLLELKKRVETLEKKKDKAEWEYNHSIETMKNEYGFSSIEELEGKLAELEDKLPKLEKEFSELLEKEDAKLREIERRVN